jgi:hypothetical protein
MVPEKVRHPDQNQRNAGEKGFLAGQNDRGQRTDNRGQKAEDRKERRWEVGKVRRWEKGKAEKKEGGMTGSGKVK